MLLTNPFPNTNSSITTLFYISVILHSGGTFLERIIRLCFAKVLGVIKSKPSNVKKWIIIVDTSKGASGMKNVNIF